MAKEMRLIDANALMQDLKEEHDYIMCDPDVGNNMKWREAVCFGRVRKAIENAPTVDAVKVVRCKDCKQYNELSEVCSFWHGVRHPEHYCGEGEKRWIT